MAKEVIRKLSDREKAREKIQIFYGSADNYIHGLKEVLANATDEIINNFDDGDIYVELHEDKQTITIRDTGRGIPMNGESDGTPNFELLFRILFAGTKYGEMGTMDGSYTGSNGVGLGVLNFTSLLFEVTSVIKDDKYHIKFENGGEVTEELTHSKTDDVHGTTITFKLDPEVYTETGYLNEQVQDIAKRYAVSSSKITVHYKYVDEDVIFHYDNIEKYFLEEIKDTYTAKPFYGIPIEYDDNGERTSVELVISTTTDKFQESYLNLNYLPEGGAINDGINSGFKIFMNKHCRDNSLFPKGVKSFSDDDIEDSLSFVAIVLSNKVEFSNQTKFSSKKKLYKDLTKRRIQQLLEIIKLEDKKTFGEMVSHLLTVQKANDKAERTKVDVRRKLTDKKINAITNRIDGFYPPKSSDVGQRYLAIVEGKSALSSIIEGRDSENFGVYPIRGKALNVRKQTNNRIMNNKEIQDIYNILGCGVDLGGKPGTKTNSFDIDNLKFDRIYIYADSDEDGNHITGLLLSIFDTLSPELIKQGKIYHGVTPLYTVIEDKTEERHNAYSEKELVSVVESLDTNKYSLARNKGLGSLDREEISMAMEIDNPHHIQYVYDEYAQKYLDLWFKGDAGDRRQLMFEGYEED